MERYSEITLKNPREIVLLRGSGCKWRKCAFCDYHFDFSLDENENYRLNSSVIERITGKYKKLEVINSGSFCDLDHLTMEAIISKCVEKEISEIHFECHWLHRNEIPSLREYFGAKGIDVKIKIGVETFDRDFRENILVKGIDESDPEIISPAFDEVCLLFGITGQTADSMINDIQIGLQYFERVCVNIMCENSTKISPDREVISEFVSRVMPLYVDSQRVDILIENTDFGVGD